MLIDTQGHNFSIGIFIKGPDIVFSGDPKEAVKNNLNNITNVPEKILDNIKDSAIKKHKFENGTDVYEFRIVSSVDKDNNSETSGTTRNKWYCYIGGFIKDGAAVIYTSRRTLGKILYPKRIKRMKKK